MRNQAVDSSSQAANRSLERAARAELDALGQRGLHRTLRLVEGRPGPRMRVDGRDVLMLAGSNYLDLAGDPRVIQAACDATTSAGCAAGGSRLINGNLPLHEQLEAALAEHLATEAALVFSSGYMANLGVLTTLAGPADTILSDALNHASIIDACRLSGAKTRVFRHNDAEDLARQAGACAGARRRLLVVDGVYSMDGDSARLHELVPIARDHDMIIIVDDTHGVGVLGPCGRGVAAEQGVAVDVVIGNLGKAFGSFGGFVACSHSLRELFVNRARSFIFTCALAPASLGAALASLEILREEPWRRKALLERAEQLRDGLKVAGYNTGAGHTHIVPTIVGESAATMRLSEQALAHGVHVQGIRYPSVPEAAARLRFTPTCGHRPEDIDRVIEIFRELRA